MYQTVGHMGIEILAKAMGLPLYRQETKGKSTQTGKHYVPTDNDEVEDLYNLLAKCKVRVENIFIIYRYIGFYKYEHCLLEFFKFLCVLH